MRLLGIDIGTTHCKAGLFEYDGTLVKLSIHLNKTHTDKKGHTYYDPEELWMTVANAIREVNHGQNEKVASVGITGMAESGLLIDLKTGEYRSHVIPWFDQRTERTAQFIKGELDPLEHFKKTGLHNSYKYALAKLLWLKHQDSEIIKSVKWLSISDFIAYKLTGKIGTDYSLAARTFAFRIDKKEWDIPWIHHFGFNESLFPEAKPSGSKIGMIPSHDLNGICLEKGTPVAVSGHDHVCAALAAGAFKPGVVSDSVGTAETLVGTLSERSLGEKEYHSGFNFGCHVLPHRFFWMGAIQSSGGSVEWLRNQLSNEILSYEEMKHLLDKASKGPTGILYYPYLSGSGSPQPDPQAKGAFIGLKATHKKEDLMKALLEGTAYEFEYMRRSAENMEETRISKLVAVGGGTKNRHWMQFKADITNCELTIPSLSEATLLGAALIAGLGCDVYKNEDELLQWVSQGQVKQIYPDQENHQRYRDLYEAGYLPLQEPLRRFYRKEL
jgi:sugar (pentulose or hexulose) kinase